MELDQLLGAASQALRDTVGGARLSQPVVIKTSHRSRTVRCRLDSSRTRPQSIILKQLLEDPGCGYSDWASLQFLAEISGAHLLAPHFLAGNLEPGFFMMEDLGPGTTLEETFVRGDETEILAVLQALAIQMARLHRVTREYSAEFESLRKSLPGAEHVGRHREAVNWLKSREKLDAWFTALEYTPPPEWDSSLKRIAEQYARPGAWLTFTHGDPAPSNNHIQGDSIRLLDFEYGGFRHALYDITAWEILCPLPAHWIQEMRTAFRGEMALTFPAAADLEEFERQWAYLCAYRALAKLTWISPEVLRENHSWVGDWTARQAVLSALSRLSTTTAAVPELTPVALVSQDLTALLQRRWPEYGAAELTPEWR